MFHTVFSDTLTGTSVRGTGQARVNFVLSVSSRLLFSL
jgi:hypothetical protein